MKPRTVLIIIFVVIVAIFAWDVSLYMDNTPRNSITQVIIDLTKVSPLVPAFVGFFFGFMTAHLFDTGRQK